MKFYIDGLIPGTYFDVQADVAPGGPLPPGHYLATVGVSTRIVRASTPGSRWERLALAKRARKSAARSKRVERGRRRPS